LASTFNQKGSQMDGFQNPVSSIGDGVFILDILMKPAKCSGCKYWPEINRRQSINLGGKFRTYHKFCRISDHHVLPTLDETEMKRDENL
jgi:hypothetical protein